METVLCDICGQDRARVVYELKDTNYGCPGTFILVQCTTCGLVYQNPRPSLAEMGKYYPVEQYHPFKALRNREAAKPAPLHARRARALTVKLGAGQILDVGCGSGLFLVVMRQLGWQCTGVEPNNEAAQFARERLQLQVHTGDISSIEASEKFDLVTFWDVLEHTRSPRATLKRAYKLLKPSGTLAINVPNWDSLERRIFRENWIALDAPRHLYHFTPQTLPDMLSLCGFVVESVTASAPPLSLSSNVLRWLGNTFLRKGQAKALVTPTSLRTSPGSASRARRFLIRMISESMRLPNALLNTLNIGSGITATARKS